MKDAAGKTTAGSFNSNKFIYHTVNNNNNATM